MPLAAPPPDGLERFPHRPVAGQQLHRLYRHTDPATGSPRTPWWFACADARRPQAGGRYDLQPPAGACYLATSAVAAALETFGPLTAIPRSELVARRRVEVVAPAGAPPAADLAVPAARGYGVTGEIHTSPDRALTRSWAEALYAAGWRALHGIPRHDPAQTLRTVTLLDEAGAHLPYGDQGWAGEQHTVHDDAALAADVARYGVRVFADLHEPDIRGLEATDLPED